MNQEMSTWETTEQVWKMMHSMRVCMMTSWNGKFQLSRPMTARVFKDQGVIYFLDLADSSKEREIKEFPAIALSFADPGANKYLAIAGHANVSNNREIIHDIWSDFDKAYFKSPDDPEIRLITVIPDGAELWDGPNKVIAGVKMLLAAATGHQPSMGENKKVAM